MLEPSLVSSARYAGRSAGRLLIPVQVALSVVLLMGASLLVRTLRNLDSVDIGFNRSHVLLVRFESVDGAMRGARFAAYADGLETRVRSLPGVISTSIATASPFGGESGGSRVQVPGYSPPADAPYFTSTNFVGTGFFRTAGIPLLRGREFDARDRSPGSDPEGSGGQPAAAIVSASFVRRFLNGRDPIGVAFTVSRAPIEIVGVAKDAAYVGLREPPSPLVYMPAARTQTRLRALSLLVRFSGPPPSAGPLAAAVRAEVNRAGGGVRVARIDTLDELVDHAMVDERLAANVSATAGALALLLVSIGLFGTVAYRVARGTRELAIRLALGAPRERVFRSVIGETMGLVLAGVALGLPPALAGAELIASRLFGVGAADTLTLTGAAALLTLVALAACVAPAYRATRIDPVAALRLE